MDMAWSKSYIWCITIFLFSAINLTKTEHVIVNTSLGTVEGIEVKSIIPNEKFYSFLGIPYAKPPVNDLRFMPPQPHEGWDGLLNCKKERSSCAQYYIPLRSNENNRYGFYGDEDCLTLSIHTPKISKNDQPNMPVIVFLMNENFRVTYNVTKNYGPDFFMQENIVIVTINHRLGSLGFLSLEDDLVPGNNGLRDVILGLEWLHKNIHNFGGNSSKITLMGNQGGAVIVDTLLHVPKAKGLFIGAILQSGTSWNSIYFSRNAHKRAVELAEALESVVGTSATILRGLKQVPADQLMEAELRSVHADEGRSIQKGVLGFIPVIEHDHPEALITKLPEESEIDINIPVMIGYNSREGLEFSQRLLEKPEYITFADRDFLLLFPIRNNYNFQINDKVYYEAVDEIKEKYFDEGYVKMSKPGEYITYIGDVLFLYPIDYTVRKYANESKAPIYYYSFDYSGDFNLRKKKNLEHATSFDGTWGASVTDELCYLFICKPLKKNYIKALQEEDSEELNVLRNMVKLWTNFAKTGNPTPKEEDFTWTPATKENKECLVISEDLEMKTNLHSDRIEFWDSFISKHRERAIEGVIKDIKDEL